MLKKKVKQTLFNRKVQNKKNYSEKKYIIIVYTEIKLN